MRNAPHIPARGGGGSPACRPGTAGSPMGSMTRVKQHGTPVSGLRRTALQQSQAANSPGMLGAGARPATAPQLRAGGAGGGGHSELTETNIKVYIRTRPAATISGATCVTADPEGSTVSVHSQGTDVKGTPRKGRSEDTAGNMDSFVFEDGVLEPEISQEDVFETIGRPAAQAVLEGYNVTVFAYGQTGAGKTHSIYGSGGQCDEDSTSPQAGLTERVMKYLIAAGAAEARSSAAVSYRYAVSMLDIYDEKVSDLFDPGHEKHVRQDPKGGVYVEGQNWKLVESCSQAAARVQQGLQGRKVCYTALNSESSRSHTICMFRVSRDQKQEDGEVLNRSGIITIVDLCGSERVKKSEVQGERKKEAININKSLSALKTVITALGGGSSHIPFRDSKLTWVLKDNIGGNSKVAIIAHINPCVAHAYESVSTLRFVSVVKTVKTRCSKNERFKSAHELAELAALEAEEERLLASAQAHSEVPPLAPAPETAEAATQVSPAKALGDELWQLKDLLRQGTLDEAEYRSSRQRVLALWQPACPPPCQETPDRDVLRLLQANAEENEDPNRRLLVPAAASSARNRALSIKIKGPAADDESEIMVRCSASVASVVAALEDCYGHAAKPKGGFILFHEGTPLEGKCLISQLGLNHGAVLSAQHSGPHTPPPPPLVPGHNAAPLAPGQESIMM